MSAKNIPFCGVCYKAGKLKDVYTNHWTKASPERNSEITCPTILNTVCKYCKERGHTMKYCRMLNEKKSREEKNNYNKPKQQQQQKHIYVDKDNDGYVKVSPIEVRNTWASVAKRNKILPRLSLVHPDELRSNEDNGKLNEPVSQPATPSIKRAMPILKDWGDCIDDEDEYEYDYNYEYRSSEDNRPSSPLEPPY